MMNCQWKDTGYVRKACGRKVYACARHPRCNRVVFVDDPSTAQAECMAPHFALGDGVDRALKQWGITPARWVAFKRWLWGLFGRQAGPCGCEKRRLRLNRLVTVPLPYVVYRVLQLFGRVQPQCDKVEVLLRAGKIKKT